MRICYIRSTHMQRTKASCQVESRIIHCFKLRTACIHLASSPDPSHTRHETCVNLPVIYILANKIGGGHSKENLCEMDTLNMEQYNTFSVFTGKIVWACCVCGVEKSCSYVGPPWSFGPISGFNGGWESFHWHGVVMEFIVNWQQTGNGSVHASMQVEYPADTFYVPHGLTRH